MSSREYVPDGGADDAPSPEVQEVIMKFVEMLNREAGERLRAAVAAGVVDPVVLALDPAHPRARAIAEAAATPAGLAELIGILRRQGIVSPLLFFARPRPVAVALLAPAFPATAAEVAARAGPGWVLAGDKALACHVEPTDRRP